MELYLINSDFADILAFVEQTGMVYQFVKTS